MPVLSFLENQTRCLFCKRTTALAVLGCCKNIQRSIADPRPITVARPSCAESLSPCSVGSGRKLMAKGETDNQFSDQSRAKPNLRHPQCARRNGRQRWLNSVLISFLAARSVVSSSLSLHPSAISPFPPQSPSLGPRRNPALSLSPNCSPQVTPLTRLRARRQSRAGLPQPQSLRLTPDPSKRKRKRPRSNSYTRLHPLFSVQCTCNPLSSPPS